MTHQQPALFRQNSTWLHYIGGTYKTTEKFVQEAETQGITRRIPAQVARGMQFGDRLVFLRWAGPGKVWAFAEGVIRGIVLDSALARQVGEQLVRLGRAVFVDGDCAISRECGSYIVTGTWQVDAEIDEIVDLAIQQAAENGESAPFVMVSAALTKAYDMPVYLAPVPNFTRGFIRSEDASFVYEAPTERPTITAITDYHRHGKEQAALPLLGAGYAASC